MVQAVGENFYISTDTFATEYDAGSGWSNGGWFEVTADEYAAWLDDNVFDAVGPVGDDAGYASGKDNLSVTIVNDNGTIDAEAFSTVASTYTGITTYAVATTEDTRTTRLGELILDSASLGDVANDITTGVEVELPSLGGDRVVVDSFPNDGTSVYSPGNINTPVGYGDFGEDLSAAAQAKRETTTDDPVTYVTSLYQEIISEATDAKAGLVSDVVATELTYQSGTSNERVVGPGIGGNSTTLDVVEGKSYVDLITSTALAVEGNDPAALAAIKTGLPNPFDYGFNLDTGIFATNEDAELYAQARVDNIANIVSTGIDAVITGYQVQQQFLTSNTDTFTIRNEDGTFQILPYTLQSQLSELNDPTTAKAIITAIQEAGGVIANADLSLTNLERLVEVNDLKTINSTTVLDEEVVYESGGAGGDLVSQTYSSAAEVSTDNPQTLTSVLETARPADFPSYADLTTEERTVLVDGLNDQIIRTVDTTITSPTSAIEKANTIQSIIDSNGYGLGLDQDQRDYLNEGLTNATNYATSYAAAYTLVNSALDSIASIQQTDTTSSQSVTQDRRAAAEDFWNSLTPFEQQVARDSGLATELDQLVRDPNNIIDSGNIITTPGTDLGNGGLQGLVDQAIEAYITEFGSISEETANNIEQRILDANQAILSDLTASDIAVAEREAGLNQINLQNVSSSETSLTKAQSNAAPEPPEPPAPVTQYQNYAAALETIRTETGGKTASEWVAEGKLTETAPGSGVFTGTVPIAPGSSISVPLTVTQSTIDAQQSLIEQTTQQRQGLLNQGIPASTLDNPVNLEKAVAQQLPPTDQTLSTTSAGTVSPDQADAGNGVVTGPQAQASPAQPVLTVSTEQATAGSGSSSNTTTLALVAAASAIAVTNSDAVVASASSAFASASSFFGDLFTSDDTTVVSSTNNNDYADYGSDYTELFTQESFVGLEDIATSAGDVNGSDIYEWPSGPNGETPYDDDGNLNLGWELNENNDPVYVGFDQTDSPADVPVQDIYQYPSGPNGETPYDDNGNLNPGWELDENNNPVYVGSDYISPSLLDSATASREYAAKLLAQQQATLEAQRKLINNGDWRVRLSLAPAADYLYNTPGEGTAGILEPLRVTNGVLFPYTPQIDTQYRAEYDSYSLTHSNYKGYFYKSSHTDAINVTATFTAQDTDEAEYLLAVIHFFRSVTKMFYGQDPERGAPPPLVYLTGLGEYQFNGHPCVVTSFNYSLPADVNYIRARSKNISYSNLLQRRDRQSLPTNLLTSALDRLFNAGVTKGAIPEIQAPPTLGLNSPTYVPTKMQITISLLPVQTRSQVSKQFSLKQFANGNLLKGGFW